MLYAYKCIQHGIKIPRKVSATIESKTLTGCTYDFTLESSPNLSNKKEYKYTTLQKKLTNFLVY